MAARLTIITRPASKAKDLVGRLEACGVEALAFPALAVRALPGAALPADLRRFSLLIFVSPNAVRFAFEAGLSVPSNAAVAAIGPASAAALRAHGLDPVVPDVDYDSEALLATSALSGLEPDAAVLIVRGHGGRELLAEALRGRGIEVQYAELYERYLPVPPPAELAVLAATARAGVACDVLITSAQALENLLAMLGGPLQSWLLAKVRPLVVSERIAERARAAGFVLTPVIIPPNEDAMMAWFEAEHRD